MRDNDLRGSLVTGPQGSSNKTFYQLAMKAHRKWDPKWNMAPTWIWILYNGKNKEVSASAGGLMLPMWM